MNFLEKHATKKNIILGLLVIAFVNVIAFPFFPKLLIGREIPLDAILDLQFSFTPDFAYQLLSNLQEDGRMSYKYSTIFIDIPYASIFGFVYSFILIVLLKKNNLWKFKLLALIPFGISIFDLLENTGILTLLSSFPEKMETVSLLTSIANQTKWSFAGLAFLIFLLNMLYLFFKKVFKNS